MPQSDQIPADEMVRPAPPAAPVDLRRDPQLLSAVARLSELSEYRTLAAIAWQWAVIALAIGLWYSLPADLGIVRWLVYALCVVVIASRQHAFLILMHEGAHGRISRYRAWNDFVSDITCAFPLGIATKLYRERHLKHHQFTNTERDPDWTIVKPYRDWQWPKKRGPAFAVFTRDVTGLSSHMLILTLMLWSPARKLFVKRKLTMTTWERVRLFAFYLIVAALLTWCHLWLGFLLFWIVPLLTATTAIARLRSIAEHMAVPSAHELNQTREVVPSLVEKLLLAPLHVNYHLSHHLFPSVPFYRLPELHRTLMAVDAFQQHAHLTVTYLGPRRGTWAELTTVAPLGSAR